MVSASCPFPTRPCRQLKSWVIATAIAVIDQAPLVWPITQVSDHNALVARICSVDGSLAIELASRAVNVLTAAKLGERWTTLPGAHSASSNRRSRQQTLRAMIDWSYELLSDAERLLLQRLSVFAGGCTLEAAEAALL